MNQKNYKVTVPMENGTNQAEALLTRLGDPVK